MRSQIVIPLKEKTMNELITTKEIVSQIFFIRGVKVMLDYNLATLYEVETRVLNQAVQRNIERFPEDFMFQLKETEYKNLMSQFETSKSNKVLSQDDLKSQNVISSWGGRRKRPFAFTEQGVAMLSGILRSERAVKINISIMRAFVKMRELIDENKELKKKLDKLESKYDKQFQIVFDAIRQLIEQKNEPREPIGFKTSKK